MFRGKKKSSVFNMLNVRSSRQRCCVSKQLGTEVGHLGESWSGLKIQICTLSIHRWHKSQHCMRILRECHVRKRVTKNVTLFKREKSSSSNINLPDLSVNQLRHYF